MEYKIKNICNELDFGVSRFYNLKKVLDNSIPEQNRIEYYYKNGRNFFITEKGYNWFKENSNANTKINFESSNFKEIDIYRNQVIEMYQKEIEYLRSENKRLLDILSVKEQRELAQDVNKLNSEQDQSIFNKLLNVFRK